MSLQALRSSEVALMPSNNTVFINFILSTFLFVQRLNAPNQRENFKNSTVPHGIDTFVVVWSVD